MTPGASPEIQVFSSPAALADAAADFFVASAAESCRGRGSFRVALAGGTTPAEMHRRLAESPRRERVDWSKTFVFFGDERCVPSGHADRNDRAADETLLSRVSLPAGNIFRVDAEKPDAAARYEAAIRQAFGVWGRAVPRFDLIVLGLGPDGHTASLFPGHRALEETEHLIVKIDGSPKPPPERVTFTLPLIDAARAVLFLAAGAEKAAVVARAVGGDVGLPSGRVRPGGDGRLVWLLDENAASKANKS
ncbi:MAG TPA: 6-phosphogluconolactonase [Thermoanaerobaculia bacterium]|nr:6-phosphogluconolactonase [Thermoanaerobaculia bacterium]